MITVTPNTEKTAMCNSCYAATYLRLHDKDVVVLKIDDLVDVKVGNAFVLKLCNECCWKLKRGVMTNSAKTLTDLLAAGVPLFKFGSLELKELHDAAKDPPFQAGMRGEGYLFYNSVWHAKRTYGVTMQVYGWSHDGYQYIVDHGGFYTLQTIHRGQVVPASEDVTA